MSIITLILQELGPPLVRRHSLTVASLARHRDRQQHQQLNDRHSPGSPTITTGLSTATSSTADMAPVVAVDHLKVPGSKTTDDDDEEEESENGGVHFTFSPYEGLQMKAAASAVFDTSGSLQSAEPSNRPHAAVRRIAS